VIKIITAEKEDCENEAELDTEKRSFRRSASARNSNVNDPMELEMSSKGKDKNKVYVPSSTDRTEAEYKKLCVNALSAPDFDPDHLRDPLVKQEVHDIHQAARLWSRRWGSEWLHPQGAIHMRDLTPF